MITFPKYEKLSDSSLKDLHQSIRYSLEYDDNLPQNQEKLYYVREIADWKTHKNAIEKELTNRGIPFEPIDL